MEEFEVDYHYQKPWIFSIVAYECQSKSFEEKHKNIIIEELYSEVSTDLVSEEKRFFGSLNEDQSLA